MTTRMTRVGGATHGLILAILIAGASPAHALQPLRDYDIPAQPLGQALATMAQQSQVEIIAPTELVDGLYAPAIKGGYSRATTPRTHTGTLDAGNIHGRRRAHPLPEKWRSPSPG